MSNNNNNDDTFRENLTIDEENGDPLHDTFRDNATNNNPSPSPQSSNPPAAAKNRIGWIIGGTIGILCIVGIGIAVGSMSGKNNDDAAQVSSSVNGTTSPTAPRDTIPQVTVGDIPDAVPATTLSDSKPSNDPSAAPTSNPSISPTNTPTVALSNLPSSSNEPTNYPTGSPSTNPTSMPSASPSTNPTSMPSASPSMEPTLAPSKSPTEEPTATPTETPSISPSSEPTISPITPSPTPYEPFFFVDSFTTHRDLGIQVSAGLSVRVIAQEGQRVPYANGGQSSSSYHANTDAAGIIPLDAENPTEGGYAYVVNSEKGDGDGGVYGIYFDKDGNVVEYKSLLTGTTDNCGGGLTPWNTWVSCEEYSDGQCWEVDPVRDAARVTKLGGKGGRYESVAVDNTNPDNPVFFTTEDDEEGCMRRFVARGNGWGALQSDGDTSFLNILDGCNFEWTDDEDEARESAAEYYRNSEGIQYHEGKLYFMAKKDYKLIILDLDEMTYKVEITGRKFYGEGSFGNQPDQNLFGPSRKYIYFTEDGGDSPGVYARYGEDGTFFTLFQAIIGGVYDGDETVGIALSPDNKKFYAGIQEGIIFEFSREDGLPFE